MSLHILGLWDIPSEDLRLLRNSLVATLGSIPGFEIFFSHLHADNWRELYNTQAINAFIFLSPYVIDMDYLPQDFSGPVCILDLRSFYDLDPANASIHSRYESSCKNTGERKEQHNIYRFTPPFSLGSLLNTLSKSLSYFPYSSPPQHICLEDAQNITFHRPQRRIHHPTAGDIFLTEKEVAILDFLIEKAPQKLTKKAILEKVWGYLPHTDLNTHTLETHIYHLRQKFEEYGLGPLILSDHEGYAFNSKHNNAIE